MGTDDVGAWAAALTDPGELRLVSASGEGRPLGSFPEARAVDATEDGGAVLSEAGALVRVAADGTVTRRALAEEQVVDLAVSPGDELVALGTLDGVIQVLDLATGAPVAVLEGHGERVSTLAWVGPDRLLSGSWDGTVRVWDLSQRATSAAQLVAEVEAAWGLDVAEALAAVGP